MGLPTRARGGLGVLLVLGLLLIGGCGQGVPTSTQARLVGRLVDPPLPRPTQVLLDDRGQPFSIADRPGDEVTVLVFGYTHCPDFCPTTAADLAAARAELSPELRRRTTVVFVTEDPQRDTPQVLHQWLASFDKDFVGLIGGNATSAVMLHELFSSGTARLDDPERPIKHPDTQDHAGHGHYGLEHSSIVYVFGPDRQSLIYTGGATAADYAADFKELLDP